MSQRSQPIVGVFGASGSIGHAVCQRLVKEGWRVLAFTRRSHPPATGPDASGIEWLEWDHAPSASVLDALAAWPLEAVVWAQGSNCTDSIICFEEKQHAALYEANVLFVLRTLNQLLTTGAIVMGARLCVISSIWQDIARPNKLSYGITKAAVRGLVQSVAIDLGPNGILINAVLPGPLDTPMTRANLSASQIERLSTMTPIGRLPALEDVCATVSFLCSPANTSITGQFVAVDGAFSHAKVL